MTRARKGEPFILDSGSQGNNGFQDFLGLSRRAALGQQRGFKLLGNKGDSSSSGVVGGRSLTPVLGYQRPWIQSLGYRVPKKCWV